MTINNIHSEPDGGPNEVTVVRVTDAERRAGQAAMSKIRHAVLAMHRDGIVIVENAIEESHLDTLRRRMLGDVYELIAREATHYNFEDKDIGNVSQVPPFFPGYIFQDIVANPIGAAIMSAVIGPRSEFRWFHGNTAVKSTKRQVVHCDFGWDYYDFPTGIVTNIMLQDVAPANGSTEIWLGTHKLASLKQHAKPPLRGMDPGAVEERRRVRPPVYPCMKKGSLILRDMRLWHAGMPNSTDTPRFMLGFLNFPSWYENSMKLLLPCSAQKEIEGMQTDFLIPGKYVPDDEYDHLAVPFDLECAPIGERTGRAK